MVHSNPEEMISNHIGPHRRFPACIAGETGDLIRGRMKSNQMSCLPQSVRNRMLELPEGAG
jgi:hypothetical protein